MISLGKSSKLSLLLWFSVIHGVNKGAKQIVDKFSFFLLCVQFTYKCNCKVTTQSMWFFRFYFFCVHPVHSIQRSTLDNCKLFIQSEALLVYFISFYCLFFSSIQHVSNSSSIIYILCFVSVCVCWQHSAGERKSKFRVNAIQFFSEMFKLVCLRVYRIMMNNLSIVQ